jgi:hypothetical protein
MISLEEIRQELYGDLKRWEQKMIEKIQHDVQAMREMLDVRIEGIEKKKVRPDR